MSLQNFSNDELLLNKESSWLSDKELLLLFDEQWPLLSDNKLLYLDDELFVDSIPFSDKDKDPSDHLRTEHRLNQTGLLLPLNSKRETKQLQPVKLDSSQPTLLKLVTCKLQSNLPKDKERDVRNNARMFETLLLNDDDLLGIQKLVKLLASFAHVTTIIDGDHYPTLSIMLPVKILQEHLFQKEKTLTHPTICEVQNEIELLFGKYWEKPEIDRYITAMLNPRFKDLNFEPEKFESTKINCSIE
ncbi:13291_t:CDS:2 [Dentiscutata heterogama]|uniref:13291_t:CDS:1 n=1 Tax=Dentiscutata heterogama TaxID=1316150 RepID=A0ACA9MM02_9GLOM|nr:13291_t:CDS:2 [Dentiscutata heterogama]